MHNQYNKRIYEDKKGRKYQKEMYFTGGKMKFRRVYVIDGIPADEFYRKNATAIEMLLDGDFHLLDEKIESANCYGNSIPFRKGDVGDLPF